VPKFRASFFLERPHGPKRRSERSGDKHLLFPFVLSATDVYLNPHDPVLLAQQVHVGGLHVAQAPLLHVIGFFKANFKVRLLTVSILSNSKVHALVKTVSPLTYVTTTA
jgi:hypothetical protein